MNPTQFIPEYQKHFNVNSIEIEQRNLLDLQITNIIAKQFIKCLPQSSIKKAKRCSVVDDILFKTQNHTQFESITKTFPMLLSIQPTTIYNIKIVLKETFNDDIKFKFSLVSTTIVTISTGYDPEKFNINNDKKLSISKLDQKKRNEFIFTLQFIPMTHWDCIYHRLIIQTKYFRYETKPFMLIR